MIKLGMVIIGVITLFGPMFLYAQDFEKDFTGNTMRLDFYHTGDGKNEIISLDRVRIEGPWPGNRNRLLDALGLGPYFFEIVDAETQRVIFSQGFSDIYSEWETTDEPRRGIARTFPESLRFPEPRKPFQVRLRKRDSRGEFHEIWALTIDPLSRFVSRAPITPHDVIPIVENGPISVKVDLVILGDGYTVRAREKFIKDAHRAYDILFSTEPFASHRNDFNVRAVYIPSIHDGISEPRSGIFRETPLGTQYNAFDTERYILTFKDRAWRDVAASVPYDFVIILVNSRKYGGGGIYRLYAITAMDSAFSPYILVHEFGHHFAGLGDEYYTSDVAYDNAPLIEPWEPNLTTVTNLEHLKWKDFVEDSTPIPTPWQKELFEKKSEEYQKRRLKMREKGDKEEKIESLFNEEKKYFTQLLGKDRYSGKVGAFEGGGYRARGIYRPAEDCIMFTRDDVGFCKVCRYAIERMIEAYTR